MKKITIIGSGLVGTLLSIYLAKRGYIVDVFEARQDPRLSKPDQGRSINLAMSCRGLTALSGVGLRTQAEKIMVPMRGRAIHDVDGRISYQPFGRHPDEYINAVARTDLNNLLLQEASKHSAIQFHFETKISSLDIDNKCIIFQIKNGDFYNHHYEHLIGADGANSVIRETLVRENLISSSRDYLNYGYKELSIAPGTDRHLSHENLHLWPRESFLLLGNPNLDYSITGSLFLPHEGKNSFADLNNEIQVKQFFTEEFPDVYAVMPHLVDEFMAHPTGNMSTIRCSSWYYQDQCLLIGDAAHGLVPFFGQGMNCGFEDCRILNDLLTQYQDDWQQVLPLFYEKRKPNTDAVALMSFANFQEIQSKIRDPQFNLKKLLEFELMKRYPQNYLSKHVLVMFTNTPYAIAYQIGEVQHEFLHEITQGINSLEEVDWQQVNELIKNYDKKLAEINP